MSLLGLGCHEQAVYILICFEVCKLRTTRSSRLAADRHLVPTLDVGQKLKVPDALVCSLLESLDALLVTHQVHKRLDCSVQNELMAITKGTLGSCAGFRV